MVRRGTAARPRRSAGCTRRPAAPDGGTAPADTGVHQPEAKTTDLLIEAHGPVKHVGETKTLQASTSPSLAAASSGSPAPTEPARRPRSGCVRARHRDLGHDPDTTMRI